LSVGAEQRGGRSRFSPRTADNLAPNISAGNRCRKGECQTYIYLKIRYEQALQEVEELIELDVSISYNLVLHCLKIVDMVLKY
jgi:hypothetical protein